MGPDNPLLLDIKRDYAGFLTSRGRLDEVEWIWTEIDEELKGFMLSGEGEP